jgi:hypothetical protein
MDYLELAELIPPEKWGAVSDQLTGFILTSKNDEKMPNDLANMILLNMKNKASSSKSGVAALLEAALLLEQEKSVGLFGEMQLIQIVEKIKGNPA